MGDELKLRLRRLRNPPNSSIKNRKLKWASKVERDGRSEAIMVGKQKCGRFGVKMQTKCRKTVA